MLAKQVGNCSEILQNTLIRWSYITFCIHTGCHTIVQHLKDLSAPKKTLEDNCPSILRVGVTYFEFYCQAHSLT